MKKNDENEAGIELEKLRKELNGSKITNILACLMAIIIVVILTTLLELFLD